MEKLSANQIRSLWLNYFHKHGHYILPSKSLIPENDPSLLWVNSGVATLKPYFSGQVKPISNRLTSSQKCIRTNDIENVGVTSRHHTFFEMLGNFSIGDYFKKEAIWFAYDLLVNGYQMPKERLYITVYEEDNDAYDAWISLGIDPHHIIKCNRDRNFWDVGNGPCGPCTEIYFDRGEKFDPNKIGEKLFFEDIENDRYVEIWNVVFSQFNNNGKNEYKELAQKNIDTGSGLERMACVLQDVPTNYDSDLFLPIINRINQFTDSYKYDVNNYFSQDPKQKKINQNFIVIADHLKASVFAISDGALPASKERGAVLRKLIRRAIVSAWMLKVDQKFLEPTVDAIINTMKEYYPELVDNAENIKKVLRNEFTLFNKTFNHGIRIFNKVKDYESTIKGETIFSLTDTYGFPYEVIKTLAAEHNLKLDEKGYYEALAKHQAISQSGSKNTKAMAQQNPHLINLKVDSKFDYCIHKIEKAKLVALFDHEFNPVQQANGLSWLVFNDTCFYATSGGQKHDEGLIIINNHSFKVLDVIKAPNGQHLHLIDTKDAIIHLDEVAQLEVNTEIREQIMANHSCEHLLQKALQTVISNKIHQEGANKTEKHLTFDFSYASKLNLDQILAVENKVNEYINSKAEVVVKEMSLDEAKAIGAQAHFEHVYAKLGNKLRVVIMSDITSEVCGGTHVSNLGDIEQFMIINFETKGSGSYRIEGISKNKTVNEYLKQRFHALKTSFDQYVNELKVRNIQDDQFNDLANAIKWDKTRVNYHLVNNQLAELKNIYNELIKQNDLKHRSNLASELKTVFDLNSKQNVLHHVYQNQDQKLIVNAINQLAKEQPNRTFVGLNVIDSKLQYIIVIGKAFKHESINAKSLINKINEITKGFGGGSLVYAQGGSNNASSLDEVIHYLNNL
ncbi:MAG: alanine--tRNA ligase [Mycoplasma sp.]